MTVCPRCNLRPCKVRRDGRPLPACSECWGVRRSPIGARNITRSGLVRIRTERGWEYEHVLVAEAALGRRLTVDEHVRWIDEDRTNNDPANLALVHDAPVPLVDLLLSPSCAVHTAAPRRELDAVVGAGTPRKSRPRRKPEVRPPRTDVRWAGMDDIYRALCVIAKAEEKSVADVVRDMVQAHVTRVLVTLRGQG